MIHVGTMGWSYNFWRGSFYPQGLTTKQFLGYYAQRFGTVEVDSTFYRIPSAQTVDGWKKQTPASFVFSLKFPKIITHIKMLKDCHEETQVFLDRLRMLDNKLGPLLLQFPAAFGTEHIELLRSFLEFLPKNHRYVVEIRNKRLLNEMLYSILRQNNVALAWVASPFMPATDTVTSSFLYVRWEGDREKVKGILGKKEVDKSAELKTWAEKLKPLSQGNCSVFGYFSKYYSGDPISDACELMDLSRSM